MILYSHRDFVAAFVATISGIKLFRYSSETVKYSGGVSWIVPIIFIPIVLIIVYLMYKGIEKSGFAEIDEVFKISMGKYLGTLFLIIIALTTLASSAFKMKAVMDLTQIYFYKKTPENFIIIMFIFIIQYIVRGDLKVIIRFNRLIFLLASIMFLFFVILLTNKADFSNLLPIFDAGMKINYMGMAKSGISTIIGIEFMYIILPHLKKKKKSLREISIVTCVSNLAICIMVIYVIAVISKYELNENLYITNEAVRNISVTNEIVERWDALFEIVLEVLQIAETVNLLFFTCFVFKKIFKDVDIKIISSLIMPLMYIIVAFKRNVLENLYIYENYIKPIQVSIYIIVPIIVLIGFSISGSRGGTYEKAN